MSDSVTITFDGLGTRWIVELLGNYTVFPSLIKKIIQETVTLFDDTYSRFKPDSLIGQLNRTGELSHPPQELIDMFTFARNMYTATKGAFDISVAASLQNAGYGSVGDEKSHKNGFWDEVKVNSDKITIPGKTSVDLGGFGKGWLLDKLAVILEQNGYPYYVINGGGDLVVSAPHAIELGLEHPFKTDNIIGKTSLRKGGLAVSSVIKRRWIKNGKTYHHIFDPSTSQPSDNGVVSTYVKGATSLITDTLATVVLLRPELQHTLEDKFGVQIIVIRADQLAD